jgi:hypothetical protein
MPIEGPLREFGVHDVFQLLDMSRKTGMLRVTSELKDDEGRVYFVDGRVVHAEVKSRPIGIEDLLLQTGKISPGDIDRARGLMTEHGKEGSLTEIFIEVGAVGVSELEPLLRQRLEGVVFEVMSWREGFFSFEERPIPEVPSAERIPMPTESLVMERARRIDEWSRLADKVPDLTVIPALVPAPEDHESRLDLLPSEWEVLTMIDGAHDLKTIAATLGRAEFDVARVAYGLATTGVIEIRSSRPLSDSIASAAPASHPALDRAGSLARTGKWSEAIAELRQAVAHSPTTADLHLEIGYLAVRTGDLVGAREAWERFLKLAPAAPEAVQARSALAAVSRLIAAVEARGDV